MKFQVEPGHYSCENYLSKGRFISYWHQINEIMRLKPGSILEIGMGNGLVRDIILKAGFKLSTLDLDGRLKPDYVGSVLKLPFGDASFDLVACFQTLEHLPYKDFSGAMAEIHRVSRGRALISLPDTARVCQFRIKIPKLREISFLIPFPRLKDPEHRFDG